MIARLGEAAMNLKSALGMAKKLAHQHPAQVDKAIDLASAEVEKHTPDSVDKAIDSAAEKAKKEI